MTTVPAWLQRVATPPREGESVPAPLPPWLMLVARPGSTAAKAVPAPEWLAQRAENGAPTADVPDWMQQGAELIDDTTEEDDNLPDWMKQVELPQEQPAEDDIPDWLSDSMADVPVRTPPPTEDDMPDFLRELGLAEDPEEDAPGERQSDTGFLEKLVDDAEHDMPTEFLSDGPLTGTLANDEDLSWLDESMGQPPPNRDEKPAPPPPDDDDDEAWLTELMASTPEPPKSQRDLDQPLTVTGVLRSFEEEPPDEQAPPPRQEAPPPEEEAEALDDFMSQISQSAGGEGEGEKKPGRRMTDHEVRVSLFGELEEARRKYYEEDDDDEDDTWGGDTERPKDVKQAEPDWLDEDKLPPPPPKPSTPFREEEPEPEPDSPYLDTEPVAQPEELASKLSGLRFGEIVDEEGTTDVETVGALKDLSNALRAEVLFQGNTGFDLEAVGEVTVVTPEQAARITKLETLLTVPEEDEEETPERLMPLAPIGRLLMLLVILSAVVAPVLLGSQPVPPPVNSTPAAAAFAAVDNVPFGGSIVFAFEYEAGHAPELEPLAVTMLNQLAGRFDVSLNAVSTQPTGAAMADLAFRQAANSGGDRINAGYLPGGALGVRGLTAGALPGVDVADAPPTAPDLIVVFAARTDDLRIWLEQTPQEVPVVAVMSAGAAPGAVAYNGTSQVVAVLNGTADTLAYQTLSDEAPTAQSLALWNAQALGAGGAAVLIAVGGLLYSIGAVMSRRNAGGTS